MKDKDISYIIYKKQFNLKKINRRVEYEKELAKLQEELVKFQSDVIKNKKRIVILVEGRDAAGKGGAIRRFTHYLNPRNTRVVALPKPTEEERGQWYFQRYISHLPKPGEIVFFDRSWYNRAVVEPVNGFCNKKEYNKFMREVSDFEKMLVTDGIILIKLWFSISKKEQKKRFKERKENPLKRWKLSPVDLSAQDKWDNYTSYKNKIFKETNNKYSKWTIIKGDDKLNARLESIRYLLSEVDYENKGRKDLSLKRNKSLALFVCEYFKSKK